MGGCHRPPAFPLFFLALRPGLFLQRFADHVRQALDGLKDGRGLGDLTVEFLDGLVDAGVEPAAFGGPASLDESRMPASIWSRSSGSSAAHSAVRAGVFGGNAQWRRMEV